MRYQFSWHAENETRRFVTDCPAMAEVMMRSLADFPKRSKEVQESFDSLYGESRGALEALLRNTRSVSPLGEIQTGIEGLIVRIVRQEDLEIC
jgi:hypothetical protein